MGYKLFDVDIAVTDEEKASKFIGKLQENGFIKINLAYLKNYINADIAIAFSHIKDNYKNYVCKGNWSEQKFEEIVYLIAKNRQMLIPAVFMRYGIQYDEGKLKKDIKKEKKRYNKTEEDISKEEQELLDYIAKHGGM